MAAHRGDYTNALVPLEKAVRLEEALVYTDPADWSIPVRHVPSAILLDAGRPPEAEVVH